MKNLFQHLEELMQQGIDPKQREDEIRQLYGQQVAVLVMDSSGFSRVSESHGIIHFLSRMVTMRSILRSVLTGYPILKYKFEADNTWVVFEDIDISIRAAHAMHRAIYEHKLMLTETEPFRICIGIGFGNLLYSETMEGYFGEEMNFAAKLGEDTADGDQTLLTERAYRAADPSLVADYESEEMTISGVTMTYYHHMMER